jgi:hypothetical protein
VVIAGLLLGIAMALLASYRVTLDGTPKLVQRGTEEWTSRSELLVTQPGFPWGRVTLPGVSTPGAVAPPPASREEEKSGLRFADPGRFSTLASLYSVISFSDQARELLPEDVQPSQIQALPRSLDSASGVVLPIVVILTKDTTPARARRLNVAAVAALRQFLRKQQQEAKIDANQRVSLQTLNFPSAATLTLRRSYIMSVLAFVLCMVCTLAWTHILQNLGGLSGRRARRRREAAAPRPAERTIAPPPGTS